MSAVWLITWNPERWTWKNYRALCAGTRFRETVIEPWTCMSRKPQLGDEVFLMKTGERPRGIIGHGRVVKEPYQALHYDAERAARGEKVNHIDVKFDRILNYETEEILSQGLLKKQLPKQQWSPQGSGIRIREEVVLQVKKMWELLVG